MTGVDYLNPIIVKEIRSRMRGGRVFVTLTCILLLMGFFSYAIFRFVTASQSYGNTPISPLIGQTVFIGLVFMILIMISMIAPAVTASAISSEKEKLTYEMLLVTPLHPARILWGKLVSSLGYIYLLIFAAIPMASLVFIFGGVAIRDIIKALIVLTSLAIFFGVCGLFFSALLGRSGRATVVTYIFVFMIMFIPLLVSAGIGLIRQGEPPRWIMLLSPISALASALSPSVNPGSIANIFWMFSGTFWFFGSPPISMTSIPRPLYHYSLPLFGMISLLLYLISTRLMLPIRRWRILWSEALLAFILLVCYSGLVGLAFASTSHRYENILISTPVPAQEIPPAVEVPYPMIPPPDIYPGILDEYPQPYP